MSDILIDVKEFSGPLDLLLELIEKSKINIYDLELSEIIIEYKESLKSKDIEISEFSKFIYILSLLISIKSNKLIPKKEESVTREDLIEAIIEYKKIKSVEDELKALKESALKYHSKFQEDLSIYYKKADHLELDKDLNLLRDQFSKVLKKFNNKNDQEEKLDTIIIQKDLDVNYYMINILDKLKYNNLILSNIVKSIKNKRELIAIFLALLELCRIQEIILIQRSKNDLEVIKKNAR
ncbi:MAG: segregation/condensation protein A [Tissierellia bacterium]|nr:segregation/condensation protein A [Tissierellia bacterium]